MRLNWNQLESSRGQKWNWIRVFIYNHVLLYSSSIDKSLIGQPCIYFWLIYFLPDLMILVLQAVVILVFALEKIMQLGRYSLPSRISKIKRLSLKISLCLISVKALVKVKVDVHWWKRRAMVDLTVTGRS